MSAYTVEVERTEVYQVDAESEAEARLLAAQTSGFSNRVQLTRVRVTTRAAEPTEGATNG